MRLKNGDRPSLGWAVLAALALLVLPAAADDPPKNATKGEAPAHVRARFDVARRGFDESMEMYRQSQRSGQVIRPWVSVDQVYNWSKRLLDLDCLVNAKKTERVSAYESHLKRMRRLEQVARSLRDAELVTRVEPLAAEFYRLEAEGWVADAKAK